MICHFPDPHPDEIFYSICARYSDRMQYRTGQALARDLFGCEKGAKVSFPNGLGKLVARLPPNHHCTVTDLISNHTLLPFYQPFLPNARVSQIKSMMEADEGRYIPVFVGIKALPKGYLRFCSHCVEEDRRRFGECYWHRVHQLPGVEICPSHGIFLQNSSVPIYSLKNEDEYTSLENVIDRERSLPVEEASTYRNALLKIAQDALWLLQNHTLATSFSSLESKYIFLLAEHGLATYTGEIRVRKLLGEFERCYSKDFLKYILKESMHGPWIVRFPHRSTKQVYQPVCHLLFIHFLGHTIETFLNLSAQEHPFGTGPWPCLNPICDRFQKKHILQCEITYLYYNAGRPRGTFSCECGFTYSRIGPDHEPEDSFRVGRINEYGHLWEAKLQELCEDPSMNTDKAAHILGVHSSTVKNHAQRLGLSDQPIPNQLAPSHEVQCNDSIQSAKVAEEALRDKHRMLWQSLREENPGDGIIQIQRKIPRTYYWLSNYDREWLALTPRKKSKGKKKLDGPMVNWEERDRQLALQIRQSALHLKKNSARPIRVTLHSLIHSSSQKHIICENFDKLPLTAQVLEEVTETSEAFALRRVEWVAECYRQEKVFPTRPQFIRRGSLRLPQAKWRSVKDAIDDALRTLNADPA